MSKYDIYVEYDDSENKEYEDKSKEFFAGFIKSKTETVTKHGLELLPRKIVIEKKDEEGE